MSFFRHIFARFFPRSKTVNAAIWREAFSSCTELATLPPQDCARLQLLAISFLREKTIELAGGLELSDVQRAQLALLVCLPILNLGLDWYKDWYSIIVYPGEFFADHDEIDESGIVHRINEARSGESWQRGPMVLSWEPIENAQSYFGHNLVAHECAHKLDALNGTVNGFPPLHSTMDQSEWTRIFEHAFSDLSRRVDSNANTEIDPYATEAPAEFFAVVSELFFSAPHVLIREYEQVYEQLRLFYRQNPLDRTTK